MRPSSVGPVPVYSGRCVPRIGAFGVHTFAGHHTTPVHGNTPGFTQPDLPFDLWGHPEAHTIAGKAHLGHLVGDVAPSAGAIPAPTRHLLYLSVDVFASLRRALRGDGTVDPAHLHTANAELSKLRDPGGARPARRLRPARRRGRHCDRCRVSAPRRVRCPPAAVRPCRPGRPLLQPRHATAV